MPPHHPDVEGFREILYKDTANASFFSLPPPLAQPNPNKEALNPEPETLNPGRKNCEGCFELDLGKLRERSPKGTQEPKFLGYCRFMVP